MLYLSGAYMPIPKQIAREIDRFHKVSPEELDGIEEYAEWLDALLHGPCYAEEYENRLCLIEIKQVVAKVRSLKIEIYSNEHPPPHFHVKSPNINASFDIKDCKKLNGSISNKDYKMIRYWHISAKGLLIKAWGDTRPTNCTVGTYHGT